MSFETQLVLEQLRYCGILETVKIRKAGFPVRHTFQDFVQRYSPSVRGTPETRASGESTVRGLARIRYVGGRTLTSEHGGSLFDVFDVVNADLFMSHPSNFC